MMHFQNPEEKINNNFIVDLLNFISKNGFSHHDLVMMGKESYLSNKNGVLGDRLAKNKTPQELLESIFIDNIDYFDRNFNYSITNLSDKIARVKVQQNEDVAEILKKRQLGSRELSIYKSGVMSSFPRYIGQPSAKVQLIKCSHDNNSYCEYEFTFKKQS